MKKLFILFVLALVIVSCDSSSRKGTEQKTPLEGRFLDLGVGVNPFPEALFGRYKITQNGATMEGCGGDGVTTTRSVGSAYDPAAYSSDTLGMTSSSGGSAFATYFDLKNEDGGCVMYDNNGHNMSESLVSDGVTMPSYTIACGSDGTSHKVTAISAPVQNPASEGGACDVDSLVEFELSFADSGSFTGSSDSYFRINSCTGSEEASAAVKASLENCVITINLAGVKVSDTWVPSSGTPLPPRPPEAGGPLPIRPPTYSGNDVAVPSRPTLPRDDAPHMPSHSTILERPAAPATPTAPSR